MANNYTIEIMTTVKDRKDREHLTIYCLVDNVVSIIECHGNEFKTDIQPYLTRHPGLACNELVREYCYAGSLYDGFHEYGNIDKVVVKLWPQVLGKTFKEAIAYLKENIQKFSNRGWKPRKLTDPEPPALGGIVRTELLPIRRYSGNDNKKTFDVIEIMMLTVIMSSDKLKVWFNEKKEEIVELAYAELENNKTYLKYDVPTSYLRLDHVGLGHNTIILSVVLKEKNGNQ